MLQALSLIQLIRIIYVCQLCINTLSNYEYNFLIAHSCDTNTLFEMIPERKIGGWGRTSLLIVTSVRIKIH